MQAASLHQCNGEEERRRRRKERRHDGSRDKGKPAAQAGAYGEPRAGTKQKARAGEQHQGEEEKKQRVR
ncbi:MAG TPA: hypothetical protein VE325_11050, partial [Burkholderiales bacterium]|nr:hypothetical protein [Burkholderiales bacterium]